MTQMMIWKDNKKALYNLQRFFLYRFSITYIGRKKYKNKEEENMQIILLICLICLLIAPLIELFVFLKRRTLSKKTKIKLYIISIVFYIVPCVIYYIIATH